MSRSRRNDQCDVADRQAAHPVNSCNRMNVVLLRNRRAHTRQQLQRTRMSRVLEPVNRATAMMVAHTTHEQYEPARRGVVQRAKNLVHAQRPVAYIDKTDSRMGHEREG